MSDKMKIIQATVECTIIDIMENSILIKIDTKYKGSYRPFVQKLFFRNEELLNEFKNAINKGDEVELKETTEWKEDSSCNYIESFRKI
jgi:hypothetical protein